MALRHPDVAVVGIGVVAGNVPLDLGGAEHAVRRRGVRATDVRSTPGADRPLVVPLETGQYVHGQDGMGDIGLPLAAVPREATRSMPCSRPPGATPASSRSSRSDRSPTSPSPCAVTPGWPTRIARCVVMGAVADHVGNQNPVAEFNMWVDPHAVDIVLRSGLPLELVGWDVSRRMP